jgi:hypothetical protein
MLRWPKRARRRLAGLAYDERTGAVCDARCQAGTHREHVQARALSRRGML